MAKPGDPRHTWQWQQLAAAIKANTPQPWTCHLCRRPINPDLTGDHRWGPTVDHIQPISRGGPAYDPDNLALAHRWCNTSKHNRPTQPPPPPTSRDW